MIGLFQACIISLTYFKQVNFQNSTLLSGLQRINQMFKYLDNVSYAVRAEKNVGSGKQYKSPGRSKFQT